MSLSQSQIQDLLPHRFPFLFVDQVLLFGHNNTVEGLFRIPTDHPFVNRRSNPPVFPAFLVVEALGQVAGLCVHRGTGSPAAGSRRRGFLVRIDRCLFEQLALAGETLLLHAHLTASYGQLHKFETMARTETKAVAGAVLTLYVEL